MMQSSPLSFRRIVILLGRIVLGCIFIYAGYAKLFLPNMRTRPPIGIALAMFALQVDSYRILAPWAVKFVADTLPFAEIALGVLLIVGWQVRIWSTLASVLILGFFAAVLRSYVMGMQINCGCFANPEPLTGWTVVRDGVLASLAVLMTVFAFIESRKPHPWSSPERA
jgi:uncharacterized membrane protein YphA (DoxX/SURF4 family)